VLGAYIGGPLGDRYGTWKARKNNGTYSPENRLVLILIPVILVPIGLLMFGFGAQKKLPWAVMYVGYGFINVGLTGTANIAMVYVVDSYFPVHAEALLLVNGLKNIVAFGFSYGAIPWAATDGYQTVRI
jgi:MFS family permease